MPTHTIEATGIPDDLFRRLDERVQAHGGDLSEYVREVLEKDLGVPSAQEAMTFDEITALMRRDFKESGMTEEEFDTLIEEAREEVWRKKSKRDDVV